MFKSYSHILSHKRRRSKSSAVQILSAAQSEPSSPTQTVHDPIEIWAHSQPLSVSEEQLQGCFTTLVPRIHKYDHVAQRGSDRFVQDLTATLAAEEGKEPTSYLSCPVGNYASFLYPECLPERLELVAYLTELGSLHDAQGKSNGRTTDKPDEHVESPRAEARKKLLEKAVAEITEKEIDGNDIIDSYRSNWLVTPEVPTADNCANLDDYVARRRLNAGIDVYWTLMGFAHGTRLGKEDQAIVRDALDAAERTMFFTNDYYSWPKEKRETKRRPVANVILFLMQHQNMSEEDAVAKTKELIIQNEQEFVKRREALYQANPDLAPKLRKWMEVLGSSLAGIHYWSKNTPRYAVPDTIEESEEEESEHASVAEEDSSEGDATAEDDEDEEEDEDDEEEEEEEEAEAEEREQEAEHVEEAAQPEEEEDPQDVAVWTPLVEEPAAPVVQLNTLPLLAPAGYMRSIAITDLQSELLGALNVWLQVPNRPLTYIKQIINELQDSTHMLADIQDHATHRSQRTPAHQVFGRAQCMNSAAYTFVRVAKIVNSLKCPGMLDGLLEELEARFIGQSWELDWRTTYQAPSEQEYLTMVDQRSGSTFRLLVRLMQAASMEGSSLDFEPLAKLLGRWYQIRHEYLGLLGRAEDLDHGKIVYPIVRCCNMDPAARTVILGIYRQKAAEAPLSPESKAQILDLLHRTGALQATYDLIRQLGREVNKTVTELEAAAEELNPALRGLVKSLSELPIPTSL
ncbi:geranylgeranyl pyrophosphate synthase [Aspergillus fijiensis CBS 313.89]|uniref:Geranylgeranyl pyrophosphate synthase n=1 Tax=Aspergillus fijiensis CBS 313.89 TaxID=1448319 RepID=A0A8G1VW47_9EURO|nr:geranylgeranyl pyrophosphate synthase [Aspergillus fijiensis CBS 313.89]RAK75195.1 geranylgeranyl pyrophosphate synthase [Aspergillus fijiensis CBS 313.89]